MGFDLRDADRFVRDLGRLGKDTGRAATDLSKGAASVTNMGTQYQTEDNKFDSQYYRSGTQLNREQDRFLESGGDRRHGAVGEARGAYMGSVQAFPQRMSQRDLTQVLVTELTLAHDSQGREADGHIRRAQDAAAMLASPKYSKDGYVHLSGRVTSNIIDAEGKDRQVLVDFGRDSTYTNFNQILNSVNTKLGFNAAEPEPAKANPAPGAANERGDEASRQGALAEEQRLKQGGMIRVNNPQGATPPAETPAPAAPKPETPAAATPKPETPAAFALPAGDGTQARAYDGVPQLKASEAQVKAFQQRMIDSPPAGFEAEVEAMKARGGADGKPGTATYAAMAKFGASLNPPQKPEEIDFSKPEVLAQISTKLGAAPTRTAEAPEATPPAKTAATEQLPLNQQPGFTTALLTTQPTAGVLQQPEVKLDLTKPIAEQLASATPVNFEPKLTPALADGNALNLNLQNLDMKALATGAVADGNTLNLKPLTMPSVLGNAENPLFATPSFASFGDVSAQVAAVTAPAAPALTAAQIAEQQARDDARSAAGSLGGKLVVAEADQVRVQTNAGVKQVVQDGITVA